MQDPLSLEQILGAILLAPMRIPDFEKSKQRVVCHSLGVVFLERQSLLFSPNIILGESQIY